MGLTRLYSLGKLRDAYDIPFDAGWLFRRCLFSFVDGGERTALKCREMIRKISLGQQTA